MNNKIFSKLTSSMLLCTMLVYTTTPIFAYTKEETVYSKLDSKGNNYETLVSSHLINDSEESLINDLSDLLNIKNTNGSEKFTQDGNNIVWNTEGHDIYYQGESKKDLPIECTVKYELNGEEISPKDLAGKNGTVKITIQYLNKDAHIVNINGKNETLYTPFVAMCGTIINNENNKNIKVSNGKVIDDGSKTILLGIAFPGLQESLGITSDKLEIPSKVEITMESNDFELGNIATFVSPKLIEDSDLNLFNNLDNIYAKVNTLQSSGKQLEDGANTLKNGTNTYLEKSQEFNSAMKQVSNGMNNANSNYSKIDSGISSLNKNSSALVAGAKQVSEGTEAISTNLKTISEGLGKLQAGTSTLSSGAKEASSGLDTLVATLTTDNSVKIAQLEGMLLNYDNIQAGLNTAAQSVATESDKKAINDAITTLGTYKAAIQSTIDTLKATDKTSIENLESPLGQLQQGMHSIASGTSALLSSEKALKEGADLLSSKSEELVAGSATLYQGTLVLADGTRALNAGSIEMKKGLSTLNTGTTQLSEANNQLTEGAGTISNGATNLANGMTKFNKEGIATICNYLNGDLKDISIRLEQLQNLAEEYNNFTALNENVNGNVKFIMIIDSIKKSDSQKEDVILNNENKEN